MKKFYSILTFVFLMAAFSTATADSYTIAISGLAYSPATLNANVGDVITIQATGNHPLRQVSESSWDANDATQLPGGFGTETSDYTFTLDAVGDIFYVCANHVGAGMKGKIVVSIGTGISNAAEITALQIYPNPVIGGDLIVKGNGFELDNSKLELFNSSGQLVGSLPLDGEQSELNVSLANGVYTAVIIKEDKAVIRKRLVFLSK